MIICLIYFFEMEAFNAQCFLDAVVRKQRQKKQSHHANQAEARNNMSNYLQTLSQILVEHQMFEYWLFECQMYYMLI